MTVSELIQLLIQYGDPNDTVKLFLNDDESVSDLVGVDRDLPEEKQIALFFETKE